MTVEILSLAEDDLFAGYVFYERQQQGLGEDFVEFMRQEIERLPLNAGQHALAYGRYHRAVMRRRFPFAIYYTLDGDLLQVHAVLDCRRDPRGLAERFDSAS